jgi:hypothetical protein
MPRRRRDRRAPRSKRMTELSHSGTSVGGQIDSPDEPDASRLPRPIAFPRLAPQRPRFSRSVPQRTNLRRSPQSDAARDPFPVGSLGIAGPSGLYVHSIRPPPVCQVPAPDATKSAESGRDGGPCGGRDITRLRIARDAAPRNEPAARLSFLICRSYVALDRCQGSGNGIYGRLQCFDDMRFRLIECGWRLWSIRHAAPGRAGRETARRRCALQG